MKVYYLEHYRINDIDSENCGMVGEAKVPILKFIRPACAGCMDVKDFDHNIHVVLCLLDGRLVVAHKEMLQFVSKDSMQRQRSQYNAKKNKAY